MQLSHPSPCALGLPGVKVTGGGGRWRIGPVSSWQKHLAGRGWGPWHIKPPGPAEAGRNSTMAGSEEVQRATALIEERLAQEEENEVGLAWGPRGFWGHPALLSREGRTRLPYMAGRCPQGPSWCYSRVLLRGGCW